MYKILENNDFPVLNYDYFLLLMRFTLKIQPQLMFCICYSCQTTHSIILLVDYQQVLCIDLHDEICKYEMEMPGINLAHADLKKYNQAPNHLYIYIYIYIHMTFQESHSSFVNKRQKISYIFIQILILLNNFYKYATLERFYNLISIFAMFFKVFFKSCPKTIFELTSIYLSYCTLIHSMPYKQNFPNVANLFAICNFSIMSCQFLP